MDYKLEQQADGTWEVITFFGMNISPQPLGLTKIQAESAIDMVRMAHSHGVLSAKEEIRRWLSVPHA